jgi:transketolase
MGSDVSHRDMANAVRALSMDAVQKANSGHPGMPMGMADVATVLFSRFLKYDAADPNWADRDRFVLSAGHGSMLIYALLHLSGVEAVSMDEIKKFRQLHSATPGHPEVGDTPGVETTTGPLGQGISTAVGMALAERKLAARFGEDLVDHHTYVIASDGDLMEGISHEAAALAGHLNLSRLIVLWDDNSISIDGDVALSDTVDQIARFESYGWDAVRVDGHSSEAVAAAIEAAKASGKPSLIACRTTIGYGAPTKAGKASSHGSPLGDEEIAGTREAIGWAHGPFVIPADIRAAWQAAGSRGAAERAEWENRLNASEDKAAFESAMAGEIPAAVGEALAEHIATMKAYQPKMATRKASGAALEAIVPNLPEILGGSADLTGSNNTKTSQYVPVSSSDYGGNYVHYGVREHGMAAAMNGAALHGGVVPYSGTFLVFTDYCRPSIRLSALMKQRVIYVMTHDSIGLGEDGPTHQPVEHLAALRAMPNLNVFRPCDPVEAAEAWAIALETAETPSIMALSRQGLAFQRTEEGTENLTAKGAYVLADSDNPQAVIMASGSEVEIAMAAREALAKTGVEARVVSAPCLDLFAAQSSEYRNSVLPPDLPRVAVEAAVRQSWDAYLGLDGAFVGMTSFGASAPAGELYEHFGITADAVSQAVRDLLAQQSVLAH